LDTSIDTFHIKKRIVFVDQALSGGGAERVLCTLIRALDPHEFEIHLLIINRLGDLGELIPDYVTIHELNVRHTRNAIIPFARMVKRIRPCTVFTTLGRTALLAIMARIGLRRFKVVARYPNMPSHEIANGALRGWRKIAFKRLYRLADVVIAQTPEMAQELVKIFRIPRERIQTILNPLDKIYIQQALKHATNPFSSKHINFVAAGRIAHQKGYDILLRAAADLVMQNPSIHLFILGADEEGLLDSLKYLAQQYGCANNVHFLGFVSNPYPYYQYCDAFVSSSRYEGLPNVICECLFLNRPVVATTCVPVVERLIHEGVTGYLVDPENSTALSKAMLRAIRLKPLQGPCYHQDNLKRFIEVLKYA
jgi:glycosyltransferase involved in cell wall biosynthesis